MSKKTYNLKFLPLFEEDLNEIVDYITYRLKNPTAAERLVEDIENAIEERIPFAESFEQFHSTRERKYPYYRIQVRNITIFYVGLGTPWKSAESSTAVATGKNVCKKNRLDRFFFC